MMVHQPVPKFMLRQLQMLTALPPLRRHRAHKIRGNITITVAEKPANEAGQPDEEWAERRVGAEGNAVRQSTLRAQDRAGVSQALDRIRKAARQGKTEKFTTLLHHIDIRLLRESFLTLRRDAAPGVDGMTWQDYERDLEPRLADLHDRVHRGAYRAQPSRRVMIPKADGKQRPLAIATPPANCTPFQTIFGIGGSRSPVSSLTRSAVYRFKDPARFGRRDIEPASRRVRLLRDAAGMDRLGSARRRGSCQH